MGLSDKPQQFPYNLRNHINNVQILVETLGVKKINLVMHDWGGLIGAGYALENIQKIGKWLY
jgi:haloalkane dehalogenase